MPNEDDVLKSLARTIARIEELLERLPLDVAKDLRARITTLRTVLLEKRPPALVLVGRRGAGKSSIVNALLGEKVAELGHVMAQTGRARWYDIQRGGGAMSVLDTRGLQEGSAPAESDEAKNALESIAVELRTKAPDLVVFVVKATEVDGAIDADLDAMEKVYDEVRRAHRTEPPLICVVTHADMLEPKSTQLHEASREPPEDIEEKLRHVALAEGAVARKIDARPRLRDRHQTTMGVSAYMSWRDGAATGKPMLRADERWHIEELALTLFRLLPDSSRAELARATQVRVVQEELASTLTKSTAAVCAGIGAAPIPVADVVPLTALQASLVAAIAWIGGRTLDTRGSMEFIGSLGANVGIAFALREGFRAVMKLIAPGGGPVISAAIAFTGTMAIGSAATAYYIRGVTMEDAKHVFRKRGSKGRAD
jgi:predicted GTPase